MKITLSFQNEKIKPTSTPETNLNFFLIAIQLVKLIQFNISVFGMYFGL